MPFVLVATDNTGAAACAGTDQSPVRRVALDRWRSREAGR